MKLLQQLTDNLTKNGRFSTGGFNNTVVTNGQKTTATNAVNNQVVATKQSQNQLASKVDTNRFEHWSAIGQLQLKYSQAQGAERSLTQVYRGLLNVAQTTKTNVRHPQQTADSIRQLEAHVSQNLNGGLQPKLLFSQTEQSEFQLNNVDLLAPKPAETINLVLPSAGKSVSFHLPAYAQPKQIIDNINRALAPLDISVASNKEQKLIFTLPQTQRRMLDEPILFSGEGVRIPAGNPVPVKLQAQGSDLAELASLIETDQTEKIIGQVNSLKTKTKSAIGQVRHFIKQIADDAQNPVTQIDITPVQQQLSSALRNGDFGSRLTGLLAQANISRDTTVALLKNKV